MIFSGKGIYSINLKDGEKSLIVDMKKEWGIQSSVLLTNKTTFEGETLLIFEDRLIWVDSKTAEKTAEFNFGMTLNNVENFSIKQVNNSLLIEMTKGSEIFLYVLSAPSRSLRYFHSIWALDGMVNYIRYDSNGIYLLGENKQGTAGALNAVSLTAYQVP